MRFLERNSAPAIPCPELIQQRTLAKAIVSRVAYSKEGAGLPSAELMVTS